MDDNMQEIIDTLVEKAPRSRLGPYRELILELRRRSRTYWEILQILADRCQVRVSISTLHDFLHAQRRMDSKPANPKAKGEKSPAPKRNKAQGGAPLRRSTLGIEHIPISTLKGLHSDATPSGLCASLYLFPGLAAKSAANPEL